MELVDLVQPLLESPSVMASLILFLIWSEHAFAFDQLAEDIHWVDSTNWVPLDGFHCQLKTQMPGLRLIVDFNRERERESNFRRKREMAVRNGRMALFGMAVIHTWRRCVLQMGHDRIRR